MRNRYFLRAAADGWRRCGLALAAAIGVLWGCHPSAPGPQTSGDPLAESPFVVDLRLPATPVKNQANSSLCWLYAMLATIESEHLEQGDSVNLSPHFLARQFLTEQVATCYLSQGREGISMRGVAPMALRLLATYGAQPYDYYSHQEQTHWNELAARVQQETAAAVARREGLESLLARLNELLDRETGFVPRYVHMLGAEYTNSEFGHSVCLADEYEVLSSFAHAPYGQPVVLPLADNYYRQTALNVPPDTLLAAVRHALLSRHPVCWEGDSSEPGYSFEQGVADVPRSPVADAGLRSQQIDRFQTTDDHCLALVGLAHDRQGRRYFLAKNSWGTRNAYGGYLFLSEDYVRLKTLCVVLPRAAGRP